MKKNPQIKNLLKKKNNPQKIEEFGKASKKFVEENYNWKNSIDKLESNFH